ncbi:UNVERIFIED_CONTAM: protein DETOXIFICATION 34 [Sesamum angustifolium]|uniref:Protein DETOXIFICATION 34 n=1 Tax=Sesamum angustifolium TaxID=2727405 RepID=A0AAW2JK26_9LAMI
MISRVFSAAFSALTNGESLTFAGDDDGFTTWTRSFFGGGFVVGFGIMGITRGDDAKICNKRLPTFQAFLGSQMVLNSVQPVISVVAVGGGWQAPVAYINLERGPAICMYFSVPLLPNFQLNLKLFDPKTKNLGTRPPRWTYFLEFLVVDTPSAYNAILGRPILNAFQAVISTYDMKIKFPTIGGFGIAGYFRSIGALMEEAPKMEKWLIHVDGTSTTQGNGADLVITSPYGKDLEFVVKFGFKASNNKVEYEALVTGMRMAHEVRARHLVA